MRNSDFTQEIVIGNRNVKFCAKTYIINNFKVGSKNSFF